MLGPGALVSLVVTEPDGGERPGATRRARAPALRTIRAPERVLFFSS